MRHRTEFCANRSRRCRDMAVFDFSRWRPSAILDFKKLEILIAHNLRSAKMHHCAKFCANRSTRRGDMAVYNFSRWRPSAILDWFYTCWDHPRRVFGDLCDCAKFGCNRHSNFDSMQILLFCALSLKMPIHAPKIGVFGGLYPQNGMQCERDP